MRKKIFTFLLALATSVGVSWAQNPSGSCGTNLSWEFDPSTGTLTITGSGAMTDWASANSRPWHSYQSDITSLSLPEGLTYIGRSAFQECQMTSVELPNSLEEIGRAAFCACGLTSVTIPDNVHTIGWSAFASCQNLSTITIGSGVTSIGYFAFSNLMIEPWPSRKLESVTCYATTPPTCGFDESFSELWNKEQVPLYVPAESVNAYKAAEDWNGFDVQAISGGSTPATGLQVVEVTSELYAGWNSNSNPFTVDVLPGFQAVTFDEAKEWTEVPTSGTAVLVYRTNGDNARVIHFFDGTITGDYDIETDFNQIYENITIFGNRYFYTAGGGSTPTEVDVEANEDPKATGVYYSTFYDSSNKYELPSGVEAFVADLSGSDLVLTKIAGAGQVIPADNAVILKANSDNITLTQTDEEAVSFSANNDLEGVDAVTTLASLNIDADECYVLSGTNTYGVGFYKIDGSSLKANKAYVIYDGEPSGAPRRLRFVFDQATSMENVQGDKVQSTKVVEDGVLYIINNGVKYNAQGQIVK